MTRCDWKDQGECGGPVDAAPIVRTKTQTLETRGLNLCKEHAIQFANGLREAEDDDSER